MSRHNPLAYDRVNLAVAEEYSATNTYQLRESGEMVPRLCLNLVHVLQEAFSNLTLFS